MPDVFISYNRQDREIAQRVASALAEEGFEVWWDGALRAGETYDEVTERNLREAGAVVVLWSKRSANSKWVRAEATVGERSSRLVPALIEDCERPVRFELVQTADLRHWRGDRNDPAWRLFALDIKEAVAARKSDAAKSVTRAAADADSTIETTFWNSIKDTADPSEFEAYIQRYPDGHFAELARMRLKAASRAQAASRPVQPRPPEVTQSPSKPAANPPSRSRRASTSEQKPNIVLMGGGLGVVFAAIGAVFLLSHRPTLRDELATAPAEAPPTVTAAVQPPPAPPKPEPSVQAETPAPAAKPVQNEAPPQNPAAAPTTLASDEKSFRDCEVCPAMVRVDGGVFMMGSPDAEHGRNAYEGPQRSVTIASFALGAYEVTEAEWAACVVAGACAAKHASNDASTPVLGVSWRDASAYVKWLSKKTGRAYRLPSEAEWEYAARGGTSTAYSWGDRFDRTKVALGAPKRVGSFSPNAFGLFDMEGNAREWVEDCYSNTFANAPADGAASHAGDCSLRTIRGGAWSSPPADMRVANRSRIAAGSSAKYMGFRAAAAP